MLIRLQHLVCLIIGAIKKACFIIIRCKGREICRISICNRFIAGM